MTVLRFNLILINFQDIPLCVAFKAMGIEDDLSITQLVGEGDFCNLYLSPSFKMAQQLKIFTQAQVNCLKILNFNESLLCRIDRDSSLL